MYISGLKLTQSIIRLQSVEETTPKMKTFVCVLLLVAFVTAEPPRFKQTFRFVRQEAQEDNKESAKSESIDAPYSPPGFKPAKEFNLPLRQELTPPSTAYGIPDTSYGAPLTTYFAPQIQYGVPKPEGENGEKSEGDSDSETIESAEGSGKSEGKKEKIEESPEKYAAVVNGQGVYYVLLPGSQLQRVQFQTENDLTNMAYTARLQYKNEDRAPIYLYSPVPQYQAPAAAYYQAPAPAYQQPSAAYYQW